MGEITEESEKIARPAEPFLASTLLTRPIATAASTGSDANERRLTTGCRAVDGALENGLSYSTVTCLSGEADGGARDISQALIVSRLLNSDATAMIIDASLSFDSRRLHRALSAELEAKGDTSARETAANMLDRVTIMKIFDFVGLTESLDEVRDRLDGKEIPTNAIQAAHNPPRGTVGDSEDEAEDEMLDNLESNAPAQAKMAAYNAMPQHSLLIIDSISQVVAPLVKNNYVQGHALLTSFMRSLAHVTSTHELCTVLLNDAMSNSYVKEEPPSMFSSCTLHPALGKSFAYMLDLHILVHQLPKTKDGGQDSKDGRAEEVSIMEVLQDRCGGRFGEWAAFTVDGNGRLKDVT